LSVSLPTFYLSRFCDRKWLQYSIPGNGGGLGRTVILQCLCHSSAPFAFTFSAYLTNSSRMTHGGINITDGVKGMSQPQFRSIKFRQNFGFICLKVWKSNIITTRTNQPLLCFWARPLRARGCGWVGSITCWTPCPAVIRLHRSPTPPTLNEHIFIAPLLFTVHNFTVLIRPEIGGYIQKFPD